MTASAGQRPDPVSDSALGGSDAGSFLGATDPQEGPSSSTPTHSKGHSHK